MVYLTAPRTSVDKGLLSRLFYIYESNVVNIVAGQAKIRYYSWNRSRSNGTDDSCHVSQTVPSEQAYNILYSIV